MNKWEAIALASFMIAIFGGMAVSDVFEAKANVEKAKAGLEECPKEIGDYRTIWVKDCIAYTKILKNK